MNLNSWYIHTINVANPTGAVSLDGSASYSAASEVECRVEPRTGRVRSDDGNIKEYDTVIATSTAISLADRIWLPGADPLTDEPKRPVKVKSATDKRGRYTLYEVYL